MPTDKQLAGITQQLYRLRLAANHRQMLRDIGGSDIVHRRRREVVVLLLADTASVGLIALRRRLTSQDATIIGSAAFKPNNKRSALSSRDRLSFANCPCAYTPASVRLAADTVQG
ncbi:hypothetical protein [Sinobacterium caligoides]|uniref:hypothetical protein n=1 Tax=Sinobacterium caligoides TaxID=933926 RepID=UPI0011CEAEA6|nr:hypothetical protein [Sinobacterium caligoides]